MFSLFCVDVSGDAECLASWVETYRIRKGKRNDEDIHLISSDNQLNIAVMRITLESVRKRGQTT